MKKFRLISVFVVLAMLFSFANVSSVAATSPNPLDDGGWELVAHMSDSGGMFDGNGELMPGYAYGTFVANPVASTPDFQRAFPVVADEILFITGDLSIWGIADYGDMRNLIDTHGGNQGLNLAFEIGVGGVISNTTGNVLSRITQAEDPWISIDGVHGTGITNQRIVWGENNYGAGTHQTLKNSHGGINVYVKAGNQPTPVTLQQSTATFSQAQNGLYVYEAVDGITDGSYGGYNGWATWNGSSAENHTAVWETSSDVNASQLDFALYHTWAASHSLGHFRLSYTTDDRSTFADGLTANGDVDANWTVLTGATISGTGGETFTILADNSILVSGNNPATTVYSVSFEGSFNGITGIRLEALTDASLPTGGAGRANNGNWHLVEFTLDATLALDTDGDGVPDDEDAFPNDDTRAVSCLPGYYGAFECTPAPAGTFVDSAGSLVATRCAIGTYQPALGATACIAAPIGSYVDTVGAAAATACPAGSTTVAAASTNVSDCNFPPTAVAGGPYLVAAGNDVSFDGSLSSDPDGDSLTETWTADGGTVSGNTYTAGNVPGIYAVCLTVNDGTVDSESDCTMVVVYDPTAGFVTGGGWIDSPVNADYQYMQTGGKATFGFVAKYKKGANVPDGNTQFQFKAGDLNFHSSSYEWLVVAGNKAQFKGEGTINGQGSYKFMITADDDNPDTFRIKIWYEENDLEIVVYDNGSQQSLGGGSIKIHK